MDGWDTYWGLIICDIMEEWMFGKASRGWKCLKLPSDICSTTFIQPRRTEEAGHMSGWQKEMPLVNLPFCRRHKEEEVAVYE